MVGPHKCEAKTDMLPEISAQRAASTAEKESSCFRNRNACANSLSVAAIAPNIDNDGDG
jgi:hypothetical protein